VVDEVGSDAVRFMMLFRKNDAVLDFDLAKVLEQSKDNPVFYVQYGHARGHSIFRNAREVIPGLPEETAARAAYLAGRSGQKTGRPHGTRPAQAIGALSATVEAAAIAHEPHRIAFYLYDLASEFMRFGQRAAICPIYASLSIMMQDHEGAPGHGPGVVSVLASGLAILGVHAPTRCGRVGVESRGTWGCGAASGG